MRSRYLTEVYREFKEKYPNMKMGQRSFEAYKLLLSFPRELKIETLAIVGLMQRSQMLFKSCMAFKRKINAESPGNINAVIYEIHGTNSR